MGMRIVALAAALCIAVSATFAAVPFNNTFTLVNAGGFGLYQVEYGASYRPLNLFSAPFYLCFYNTTPGAYTLALRMGTVRSESLMIWAWEANRGKPVGENAVFALRGDGNLVLAEADGSVVWESGTTDVGVLGCKVLPTGNIVLYGRNNKYLWQSFDHPTDSLLVGQSLQIESVSRLVSRKSDKVNADGPYSLEIEPTRLGLYYTTPTDQRGYIYFNTRNWLEVRDGQLTKVTLSTSPKRNVTDTYEVSLNYQGGNSSAGKAVLARTKNNPIYSLLRLTVDGDLQLYVYDDNDDQGGAWKIAFKLFDAQQGIADGCQLPDRCGEFGLCEKGKCVSCPTTGKAWSASCRAPRVTSCRRFAYMKLAGVIHFGSAYSSGDGPMEVSQCREVCSVECTCVGYFYDEKTSMCSQVNVLKTLIRVNDTSRLAFIKVPT